MKRVIALFLVVSMILLPSCAETEDVRENLDEWLADLTEFTAETVVTAEFSDRTVPFKLRSTVKGDSCRVEVLEPANITGIAVMIAPGGVVAEYDGASFEVGDSDSLGLQPVTVVAELKRLWTGGTPVELGRERCGERDCLLAVYLSGGSETRMWLDLSKHVPVAAEFFLNGARTLSCEFVSFAIGGS